MNKRQTQVEKKKLTEEEKILKNLKRQYMKAAEDVAKNIKLQTGKIDSLLMDFDNLSDEDKSILRSVTYRREFQNQLKEQIDGVLDVLNSNQHKSIDEYLKSCYELGFVGSMFDMHGQDVPLILPMDNKAAAKAVKLDPKLSTKLYGAYTRHLKTHIRNEISRGIMTGDTYTHIARNIANRSNQGFNRAMTIVRTEGHRIHMESAYDAMNSAKEKGADVVKQWNSQLDGKTRKTHRKLDGQIRKLDEPFEVDGKKVMFPSKFGRPEEDINCRCTVNQRARWALDDDELETLKKRAEYFELDKADGFDDFKKKYLKGAEEVKTMPDGFVPAKTIEEAQSVAKELGVKYSVYDDLPLETANRFNEALMTVPEECRPVFVGSSKMLEQYRHAKLPRSSKNFYGVTIETDSIFLGIDASEPGAAKSFWDFDTYGDMVAISSSYKTAAKITAAKKKAQEAYVKKHGKKWFFNENGEATLFHEMGHAYANKYGLPDGFEAAAERWWKVSGCDMLQKPSEAWAEAWGAYYTKNPDLPDYISEYIKAASVQKATNKVKNALPLFDDDGIMTKKIELFKKDFEEGKISTRISFQKQARHIKGRKEFETYKEKMFAKNGKYPSYMREDLTNDDLERLVVSKLQGNVQVNNNDEYREFVKCDEVIGYYYDKAQGKYVATKTAQIKYALGGKNIHIIPVKEL